MNNKPVFISTIIVLAAITSLTWGELDVSKAKGTGGQDRRSVGIEKNGESAFQKHSEAELEELKRMFAQARVKDVRRQIPSHAPDIAREKLDAVKNACIARAKEFHAKTGLWYYVEGDQWDEWSTAMTYNLMRAFFFERLEDLPGYSPENRQKAIAFWQSWQNKKTGNFYNPFFVDPQHPDLKRVPAPDRKQQSETNHKYLISILKCLGAEPVYPYSKTAQQDEQGGIDIDAFWNNVHENKTSNPPGVCVDMAWEIDKGQVKYLPHIEAGLAALIRKIHPETGTIYPEKRPFSDYITHVHIFKLQRRVISKLGLENISRPCIERLIDSLVDQEPNFTNDPDVLNNTTDMMGNMLRYTDYRHEDILKAMERQAHAYTYELKPVNYGYTMSLLILSGYLNWQEYPLSGCPHAGPAYSEGAELKYRYVVGPYGNWVNAIEKRPEEILGHPDYCYAKYGMKPRNKRHWQKTVIELAPIQAIPLENDAGSNNGQGTLVVNLTKEQLADVDDFFFQARWNGRFDLEVNGVSAKTVWYAFDVPGEKAGLAICDAAQRAFQVGRNIVTIKQTGLSAGTLNDQPESPTFIELGLIKYK